MNASPQDHLLGSAPNDVPNNDELQFHLKKDAAEAVRQNDKVVRKRENRLNAAGAYRVMDPPERFERVHKPRYGGTVHNLQRIEGDEAVDAEGKRHNIKFPLPVPRGSASIPDQPMARKGSAVIEQKNVDYLSHMQCVYYDI